MYHTYIQVYFWSFFLCIHSFLCHVYNIMQNKKVNENKWWKECKWSFHFLLQKMTLLFLARPLQFIFMILIWVTNCTILINYGFHKTTRMLHLKKKHHNKTIIKFSKKLFLLLYFSDGGICTLINILKSEVLMVFKMF